MLPYYRHGMIKKKVKGDNYYNDLSLTYKNETLINKGDQTVKIIQSNKILMEQIRFLL